MANGHEHKAEEKKESPQAQTKGGSKMHFLTERVVILLIIIFALIYFSPFLQGVAQKAGISVENQSVAAGMGGGGSGLVQTDSDVCKDRRAKGLDVSSFKIPGDSRTFSCH